MLWLIGMMGAGKSSVGRRVAVSLGVAFVDTDDVITDRDGRTVQTIFAEDGEAMFRTLEEEAIGMAAAGGKAVVATGGGAVLSMRNVELMRGSGVVVWLAAEPAELAARTGDGRERPLLAGSGPPEARLTELADERATRYELAAHHTVRTDQRSLDAIAEEVAALWPRS